MQGKAFPVIDRPDVGQRWVRLDDFILGPMELIDSDVVAQDPHFSLYCVDLEDQSAVFVETPDDASLGNATFMFEVQRSAARRIVKVPLEAMHHIASHVSIDPHNIALIYSVGRCGSTLLSKALGSCEGVASLSEPDVMTQLLWLWGRDGLDCAANERLLRDCTIMQCLPSKLNGATHWALKFRSYVTVMGSMYGRCLPQAKAVFLYRGLIPWLKSYIRMLGGEDLYAPYNQEYVSFLGSIIPQMKGRTDVPLLEVSVCAWIGSMEAATDAGRSGVQALRMRYEELASEPLAMCREVSRFCGFEVPDPNKLRRVFEQDSQDGSVLSRDSIGELKVTLTDSDLEFIDRLLRTHSRELTSSVILPDTYIPS